MRMADMTPKQLVSVPCPTCGVSAGARCLLHSGGLRAAPHVTGSSWRQRLSSRKELTRGRALVRSVLGIGSFSCFSNEAQSIFASYSNAVVGIFQSVCSSGFYVFSRQTQRT